MRRVFQAGPGILLGSFWLAIQLFLVGPAAAQAPPAMTELDRGLDALSAGEWRQAGDLFAGLCEAFPETFRAGLSGSWPISGSAY